MKESLSLFSTHMSVGITENKTDGGEEVAFPGSIAADDDIVLGREWLDDRLILIAVSNTVNCSPTGIEHSTRHLTF